MDGGGSDVDEMTSTRNRRIPLRIERNIQ